MPHGEGGQALPAEQFRTAFRTIYGAPRAPLDPDGSSALLWMRAYGIDAAVVGGARSREYYKNVREPSRFQFIGTELWRDGDDAIYSIPRRSRSLAQVVPSASIVKDPPKDGGDIAEIQAYVQALQDSSLPLTTFTWRSRHSATIEADIAQRQALSVQIAYAPGWHARVGGKSLSVRSDGLGLVVVDPHCSGRCEVDLFYDGGGEALWTRCVWAQAGFRLCAFPLAEISSRI